MNRMKKLNDKIIKYPNVLGLYVNSPFCRLKDDKDYFPRNLPLINEMKRKYDPENFFHKPPCVWVILQFKKYIYISIVYIDPIN